MGLLKYPLLALLFTSLFGCVTPDTQPYRRADKTEEEVENEKRELAAAGPSHDNLTCAAADEYIATHKFLTSYKKIPLGETTVRKIANQVSLHCKGASQRFQQSLELLSALGVGVKPSLEISLKMASETDQVQMAFVEILKSSYLSEYLDLNFSTAINLAYQFSIYSATNAKATRSDFTQFVAFCKDQQELGLSLTLCTQYAVELAKISVFYKEGLFADFQKVFSELKETNTFGLSLKESLQVTYDILSYGPLAPENFKKSYEYATVELSLTGKDALNFALDMAGRSLNQHHPLVNHERFVSYVRVPDKPLTLDTEAPQAPLPGESPGPVNLRNPAADESTSE